MQVKEGGTSLHKTFRGINLAFKGLNVRKDLDRIFLHSGSLVMLVQACLSA